MEIGLCALREATKKVGDETEVHRLVLRNYYEDYGT